jgi:hypothetical protein
MAVVRFTGTRAELFGIMFRGYLGMVPTLGLYRFWMVTWKRRFYWSHTEIDGDTLEYTGDAMQLLIGFMMALVLFVPGYALVFFFSTQPAPVTLTGYAGLGLVLWFLIGYAIYRTRDFRLSRTLWRGIRFDQKGSAFGYALRRFLWSGLMVLTLGLAYPFMAGNLWRYRYRHTWFGDRQFGFKGSWRTVAGPYYAVYFGAVAIAAAILADLLVRQDFVIIKGQAVPHWPVLAGCAVLFAYLVWGVYFYRGREISRMFSSVTLGEAAVSVRVRGRAMFGQFIVYAMGFAGAIAVFLLYVGMLIAAATGRPESAAMPADLARVMQGSLANLLLAVGGYLALLATFAVLGEVVLAFGYWKLVAREARIANADSLKSVRASGEDPSLMGEGIASALNLGSY